MTDKERIDYLYELLGLEAGLHTRAGKIVPALNEMELRNYPKRMAVDKRGCGVTLVRTTRTLTTEQKTDIGLENRFRLERVLRNGDPLQLMPGNLFITGTLRTDNVPVDISGHGNVSRIVQMDDNHLFNLRTDGTRRSAIYISDIEIRTGVSVSGDKFKIRIEASNYGGDVAGRLERISIIRADAMEDSLGGGIYVNNPNEFRLRDINYLGKAGDPGTGFLLESSLASISLSLENCKVYDAAAGFVVNSDSIPGIEGLMFYKCDAVGVAAGFRIKSTAPNNVYLPPQIDLIGCHVNVADYPGAIAYEFENYAQINVSGCSAYLGGEGQKGFSLETCSEAKFIGNRAYNNSTGAVTGFYIGTNNVYCSFVATTGALGEGNPLFHISEGAAFTTIETANDITNQDPILDEGVGTRIENVYKGNTGRTLGERITAYERTWPFRTQDEQLYVRRYPSDDPNFPDRLTVESRQPFLNAYTSEAPAELWWKLWESLPATNAGNRDFLHFSAQVGRWENLGAEDGDIARQLMDITITTREGINVQWDTSGNISTSGIVIFNDGGKASVWMCLKSATHLQSGSVSVLHRLGAPMPRQLWPGGLDEDYYTAETGARPVTSQPFPDGQKVFDSRQPGTYKPLSWRKKTGLLSRVEAAATTPDVTDILPGYCMQVYDPAKQEIVTWYHDPDDAAKPIKATMRKPVPVENYTQFLADKTGGVTKFPLWNTRDQRYEYIDIATARDWLGLGWIYQTSWAQVYELLDTRYVRL